MMKATPPLQKRSEYVWEIPLDARAGMRVPGRVFADAELLRLAEGDRALEQVVNVACLPGIQEASMAMPDIHWGYGFPIGGVAATGGGEAVVSPGGVGYDICCGVRLVRTALGEEDVRGRMGDLLANLAALVPKGLGVKGRMRLGRRETEEIMRGGVPALLARGVGWEEDLEFIEEGGVFPGADPSKVSERAFERGRDQVGTLGSGNHFLEVQKVDKVYSGAARVLGLEEGQVVVMIHSGSRGLGHQVCTDYVKRMSRAAERYGIQLPDRQLACAPVGSPEGSDYLAAMACAANFALANREGLTEWVREGFEKTFRCGARGLGMTLLYDISHNLAKRERHLVGGKEMELVVHRKGATRSFPGSRPEVPAPYREVGQPVIIPGDMGSCSFVMVGTEEALALSFGSTCHGAGRSMSRSQAKKKISGSELRRRLEEEGILVEAATMAGLAEEAPEAYKDVERVTEVCDGAGLSLRVARLRPMAVLKG
jgi:tRNA-splicing ligase RtcB